MKKRIVIVVLSLIAIVCTVGAVLAEGTVTATYTKRRQGINQVAITWITTTNGVAATNANFMSGDLRRCIIVPGTGASMPTNLYDITLTDVDGIDTLAGQGANLTSNVTYSFVPGVQITDGTITSIVPFSVNSILSLIVTNAGIANAGAIRLLWEH